VISQRGGQAILPCSVTMTQPATVSKYLYYFKSYQKQPHIIEKRRAKGDYVESRYESVGRRRNKERKEVLFKSKIKSIKFN